MNKSKNLLAAMASLDNSCPFLLMKRPDSVLWKFTPPNLRLSSPVRKIIKSEKSDKIRKNQKNKHTA